MRILITNNTLASRAGSELYVRDIALELLRRGHLPIAYSMILGKVADELRSHAIPVVDDLAAVGEPPDIIHAQHHYETMTALLHFPGTPAVSFCHGWLPWEEAPPFFPRIYRYVAVDDTCRDRLVMENGIPQSKVSVLLNFVDMDRFKPRGVLPESPRRAAVFSNGLNDSNGLEAIRQACARRQIDLDVIGLGVGNPTAQPESILPKYDLVFAKARSALESLAVGCAVIACDVSGVAGMVTSENWQRLRRLNFGIRSLSGSIDKENILREIDLYDAQDAARVSAAIRESAGLDNTVSQLLSLYQEVIGEAGEAPLEPTQESVAAAFYLRQWGTRFKSGLESQCRAEMLSEELRASKESQYRAEMLSEELRAINAGPGYSLLTKYRQSADRWFPAGSRRRVLYSHVVQLISRRLLAQSKK